MGFVRLPSDALIEYAFVGDSSSEVLFVFLHEALGSIAQWKQFPDRLCQASGVEGLIYNRTGHGSSSAMDLPRTPGYLHVYADELSSVLESLEVSKPVWLVGHSDGGSIALIAGINQLPNLLGIITLAAHTFVDLTTLSGVQKAKDQFNEFRIPERLSKYHGDKTDTLIAAWQTIWLSEDFKAWSILNDLETINVPALIIQGTDDEYGEPRQVDDTVKRISGPSEGVMIPDAGHSPHLSHGETVLEEIVRFFNSWREYSKPNAS